ncbi:hypothetical protein ACQ4M4_27380 [Leptolyngbya sp. AN02str]|uniref:hypothetical protein n=1 Tax=Leptolyngbya sp. AN02str TaxID=3423363 RepID=UPI003D30FCAC
MFRKTLALVVAIAPSLLVSLPVAAAPEASYLGQSTVITWDFDAGYLCVTQDGLGSMSRTASIHRYRLVRDPQEYTYNVIHVNSAAVYPSGNAVIATAAEPFPTSVLFERGENDGNGWFARNIEPDELGAGCVNGGIAGGIQALERTHGIRIRSNP